MKITLVHPRYFNSWEALGLAYIGAYVKKQLPQANLEYFQGCFDDDDTIINAASDSDIVAFSCNTPTFPHAVKLARRIKKLNPRVHTVTGGYGPSAERQGCLVEGIDQVVIGEGEDALVQIARGERGRIIQGRRMSFEELPFPDRALVRNERNIEVARKDTGLRITSFQSHRACPFMCRYCLDGFNKVLYQNAKKVTVNYRPVTDFLDEIETVVHDYSLDLIKFSDPTWNTSVEWVVDFCKEKIRRGIEVPFYPNIHATIASQEMIELMAKAQCHEIAVGVESGSPKILKQIGKGTTVQTIRRTVEWAKQAGILVRGYFILGMPDETEDDMRLTEEFAESLDLDEYGFTILCPYPGTDNYDAVKHARVNWADTDEYSNDFWSGRHLSNSDLKAWQARLTKKFSERLTWHNRVLAANGSVDAADAVVSVPPLQG